MGQKIAIVGAGAVGGYAGAHMVQAGEDVTFIDPWPEHVEHMRQHGLRVTHAKDVPEFSVSVRALHLTDVQQLAKEAPVDIAFVCMKSYDTAWATMMIRQYLAPNGYAGAHMVQAGEDVTFIDPWPEHVEHMRKHGLRVTHAIDRKSTRLNSSHKTVSRMPSSA